MMPRHAWAATTFALLLSYGCSTECRDSVGPGSIAEGCCSRMYVRTEGAAGQVWWFDTSWWSEPPSIGTELEIHRPAQVNPPPGPSLVATTTVTAVATTLAAVAIPDIPPGTYDTSLSSIRVTVSDGPTLENLSDADLVISPRLDQWYSATDCYTVPGPPPPPPQPYPSVVLDLNIGEDDVDRVALNIWTLDSQEAALAASLETPRSVDMYPLRGDYRGPRLSPRMTVEFNSPASGSFLRIELISLEDARRGPAAIIKVP